MKKYISVLIAAALFGCEQSESPQQSSVTQTPKTTEIASNKATPSAVFTDEMAKQNLSFIKDQYLKLIGHVDNNAHVELAPTCDNSDIVCFPRAMEHKGIYLEMPEKWTNGFYPGVLWKILSAHQDIANFTKEQQAKIFDKASFYQAALIPETTRRVTHDLGFILYDSFGEALNYDGLPEEVRTKYLELLDTGRDTLATRYSQEYGLIESWDWIPYITAHYKEGDEVKVIKTSLAEPWTFPVIVDNMMNLEYLFSSDNIEHQNMAYSHAEQTYLNHYFYSEDDKNKEFPIAYHLYSYDKQKPGNWQGISNVSAWARGQAWSLYGYVTVVEALKTQGTKQENLPDFDAHLLRLINSVEKLLGDDFVPPWDYFAINDNAAELAKDQSDSTTIISNILSLCDYKVPEDVTPYDGYEPIKIRKDILSTEAIEQLSTMTSLYDEPMLQGDYFVPCGTKPYNRTATHIPKDTSAAALYAAALYRYAEMLEQGELRSRVITFADNIMNELTKNYLTSKAKGKDYELGFVLAEATGNLPNGSEINTSIVYADFYFLEANMRKLALSN